MKQKEMLVELLKEALPENPLRGNNCTCKFPSYEEIAERMLDRIVVLPFRTGETVYAVDAVNVFDDSVPGNSRAEAEKLLKILCEGFLDMPSGCSGCPLSDTQTLDEEGNAICELEMYLRGYSEDALTENKCGRWIMRGGKRYCSVCGDRACVTRDADDFWYTVGTKYCPSCGTKMDTH